MSDYAPTDFFDNSDRSHAEPQRQHPQPSSRYTPPRSAVEREADPIDGERTPVNWGGVTLLVPQSDDMDMDVIESFENGKAVETMRRVFGEAEFAEARREFERINGHRPKVRDLNQLSKDVIAVWGFQPGE